MRILHTMIRVGDLSRSLAFYTEVLGMQILRQTDYPEGRFTNTFVGYGSESERVDGYDVTYEYAGRQYRTRRDYHPGERIRVRVDVSAD